MTQRQRRWIAATGVAGALLWPASSQAQSLIPPPKLPLRPTKNATQPAGPEAEHGSTLLIPPALSTTPGVAGKPLHGKHQRSIRASEHLHGHLVGPLRHGSHLKRAAHHAAFFVKDKIIGEPYRFDQPPLGATVGRYFETQAAHGAQHWFTLYRSDFYAETTKLTPNGIQRLRRIIDRWPTWYGSLLIEDDPVNEGLGEARRTAVAELVARSGRENMITMDRMVVGNSRYYGERGDIAIELNGIVLERTIAAPNAYSLPPLPTATIGN